jgi:hypothetical protein
VACNSSLVATFWLGGTEDVARTNWSVESKGGRTGELDFLGGGLKCRSLSSLSELMSEIAGNGIISIISSSCPPNTNSSRSDWRSTNAVSWSEIGPSSSLGKRGEEAEAETTLEEGLITDLTTLFSLERLLLGSLELDVSASIEAVSTTFFVFFLMGKGHFPAKSTVAGQREDAEHPQHRKHLVKCGSALAKT